MPQSSQTKHGTSGIRIGGGRIEGGRERGVEAKQKRKILRVWRGKEEGYEP